MSPLSKAGSLREMGFMGRFLGYLAVGIICAVTGCRSVGNPRLEAPIVVARSAYITDAPWTLLRQEPPLTTENVPLENGRNLRRIYFSLAMNETRAINLATSELVSDEGWIKRKNVFEKRLPRPGISNYKITISAGKMDAYGRIDSAEADYWVGIILEEIHERPTNR